MERRNNTSPFLYFNGKNNIILVNEDIGGVLWH